MYGDPLMDLDLSGNTAQEAAVILSPGRHVCVSRKAQIKSTATNRSLNVLLEEINGAGIITARLNIWAQNADAQRISRDQLKSLAVYGGHPNPDKPLLGGLETLANLPIGVVVGLGKPYEKDGKTITPNEVKGFYKLEGAELEAAQAFIRKHGAKVPGTLNDGVPF